MDQHDLRAYSREMDHTRIVHHRDGTITYWAVYRQQWQERAATIPDRELAAMRTRERERAIKHLAISKPEGEGE